MPIAIVPLLLTLLSTATISPLQNGDLSINVTTSHMIDANDNVFDIASWMAFVINRNLITSEFITAHPYDAKIKQSTITSYYDQPLTAILSYDVLVVPSSSPTSPTLNITSVPLTSSSSSSSGVYSSSAISSSYSSSAVSSSIVSVLTSSPLCSSTGASSLSSSTPPSLSSSLFAATSSSSVLSPSISSSSSIPPPALPPTATGEWYLTGGPYSGPNVGGNPSATTSDNTLNYYHAATVYSGALIFPASLSQAEARWDAGFTVPFAGTYIIGASVAGGVNIYIDGTQYINNITSNIPGPSSNFQLMLSFSIALTAGTNYSIVVEFFGPSSGGLLQLLMQAPNAITPSLMIIQSKPAINCSSPSPTTYGGTTYYAQHGVYTYTAPTSCTNAFVQLWGAGGGGGNNVDIHSILFANPGGSGGYTEGYLTVIPGQSYTVTVGQGGIYGDTSVNTIGGGAPDASSPYTGGAGGGRTAFSSSTQDMLTAGGGGGAGGVLYDPLNSGGGAGGGLQGGGPISLSNGSGGAYTLSWSGFAQTQAVIATCSFLCGGGGGGGGYLPGVSGNSDFIPVSSRQGSGGGGSGSVVAATSGYTLLGGSDFIGGVCPFAGSGGSALSNGVDGLAQVTCVTTPTTIPTPIACNSACTWTPSLLFAATHQQWFNTTTTSTTSYFTVPSTCSVLSATLWGGGGGGFLTDNHFWHGSSGNGGLTYVTFNAIAGQVLTVISGGPGAASAILDLYGYPIAVAGAGGVGGIEYYTQNLTGINVPTTPWNFSGGAGGGCVAGNGLSIDYLGVDHAEGGGGGSQYNPGYISVTAQQGISSANQFTNAAQFLGFVAPNGGYYGGSPGSLFNYNGNGVSSTGGSGGGSSFISHPSAISGTTCVGSSITTAIDNLGLGSPLYLQSVPTSTNTGNAGAVLISYSC